MHEEPGHVAHFQRKSAMRQCRVLTVSPGQAASLRPLQRSQDKFCSMWYDVTTMDGSCSIPCTL